MTRMTISGPGILYRPIDEILQIPRVRILRALSRLGWVETADLTVHLEVTYDEHVCGAYVSLVSRMVREGVIDRRATTGGRGSNFEHAISAAGRAELAEKLRRAEPEREALYRYEKSVARWERDRQLKRAKPRATSQTRRRAA